MALMPTSLSDFLLQSQGMQAAQSAPTMPQFTAPMEGAPSNPLMAQGAAPDTSGLFGRPKRDPALSMALINAGMAMLQPTPPGQTHLGQVGKAVGLGAQTFMQEQDRQQQRALRDKESNRQDKMVSIAERGDARQQTRAEQETEEFTYGKTRRQFNESLAQLQKDGAELGLDAKRLQLDLAKRFGAKEAQAKLDLLMGQADYYKKGGKAGATKVASKVQEISSRAAVYQSQGLGETEAWAKAWADEDRTRGNPYAGMVAQTSRMQVLSDMMSDPLLDDGAKASAKAAYDALQAQATSQGNTAAGVGTPQPGLPKSLDETKAMITQQAQAAGANLQDPAIQAKIEQDAISWWTANGSQVGGM